MQHAACSTSEVPEVNLAIIPLRANPGREDARLMSMIERVSIGDDSTGRRRDRMKKPGPRKNRVDSVWNLRSLLVVDQHRFAGLPNRHSLVGLFQCQRLACQSPLVRLRDFGVFQLLDVHTLSQSRARRRPSPWQLRPPRRGCRRDSSAYDRHLFVHRLERTKRRRPVVRTDECSMHADQSEEHSFPSPRWLLLRHSQPMSVESCR